MAGMSTGEGIGGAPAPVSVAGEGGVSGGSPAPAAGALVFDLEDGASALLAEISFPQPVLAEPARRLVSTTRSIAVRIQPIATPMVIRVKTSPALVPKALEPPTPPKAPARPPPLPRWIRITQIKNSDPRTIRTFK